MKSLNASIVSNWWLFLAILIDINSLRSVNGLLNATCTAAYECANMDIHATECSGYFSCYNVTSVIAKDNDTSITCDGSYSCYKAYEIYDNSGSHPLNCSGLYSCADAQTKIKSTGPFIF